MGGRSEDKIFHNQHKASKIGSVTTKDEILITFPGAEQWRGAGPCMASMGKQERPGAAEEAEAAQGHSHFFSV